MTRILVVEDEPDVRANIVELLTLEGYEVTPAENGQAGYFLAVTEPFDLVICDILMPGLDGLEVIKRLRRHPRGQTVPVIFLTARTQREAMREGMELGADDYISKPFTRKELLASIQTRLSKQKAQVTALQSRMAHFKDQLSLLVPLEMEDSLYEIRNSAEKIIQNSDQGNSVSSERLARQIQLKSDGMIEGLMKYLLLRDLEYKQKFHDRDWNPRVVKADQMILAILQEKIPQILIQSETRFDLKLTEDDLSRLIEVLSLTIIHCASPKERVELKVGIDSTGEWASLDFIIVPKPEISEIIIDESEPTSMTNLDRDFIILARIISLLNGSFVADMNQQASIQMEIRLPTVH